MGKWKKGFCVTLVVTAWLSGVIWIQHRPSTHGPESENIAIGLDYWLAFNELDIQTKHPDWSSETRVEALKERLAKLPPGNIHQLVDP